MSDLTTMQMNQLMAKAMASTFKRDYPESWQSTGKELATSAWWRVQKKLSEDWRL